jgi:hypothetical protein
MGKDSGPNSGPSGKRPPPEKDVMERNLQFDIKPYRITADLSRKDLPAKRSRFQYEVSLEGFPRMRARFFRKNNDTRKDFSYRISFRGLVEYNSTGNATVGLGYDNDKLVQQLSLVGNKARWTPFSCQNYPNASSPAKQCNSNYTSQDVYNDQLRIMLSVYLTPKEWFDARARRTFSPNQLKFDLLVSNWKYKSPVSKLAFVLGVDSMRVPVQSAKNPQADDPDREGCLFLNGDFSDSDQFGYTRFVSAGIGSSMTYPLAVSSVLSPSTLPADVTKNHDDDDDRDSAESPRNLLFTVDTTVQPTTVFFDPLLSMADNGVLPLAVSGVVLAFSVLFALFF